jgi:hypothetical protein
MATSPKSDGSAIGCLVGLGILGTVGFFIWTLLPESWTDPWKYSVIYSTNSNSVHYTDRPKDCDFIHAPLGDKGCHYKKVVYGYNIAGVFVAGDDAPIYSSDVQTGRPVISYDNRKTWQFLPEGTRIDTHVDKVEIDWVKVKE